MHFSLDREPSIDTSFFSHDIEYGQSPCQKTPDVLCGISIILVEARDARGISDQRSDTRHTPGSSGVPGGTAVLLKSMSLLGCL